MAIERKEHPGRVRGIGDHFGVRSYFGPPPRRQSCTQEDQQQQFLAQLGSAWGKYREEHGDAADATAFLNLMYDQSKASSSMPTSGPGYTPSSHIRTPTQSPTPINAPPPNPVNPHVHQVEQSSSQPHGHEDEDLVPLFAKNKGKMKLVAYGVITTNRIVHGKQLNDDQVRVSVRRVEVPFAPLACPPNEDITLVKDALNTFVAWPKKHVDCQKSIEVSF